jgi:hypothetical protein
MDTTQALKDAENALRDFMAVVLARCLGQDWSKKCGVSSERLAKWYEIKEVENKRQEAGVVDERLIYYADFYDLKTILKKNWSGELSQAFGDWKTFEVYFDELEKMRDVDAHRRELLPYQKHLVLGISGEIRSRIVRYRSKKETAEDYFPRIESVRDNLGHIWIPAPDRSTSADIVATGAVLRPGDALDFIITASDPENSPLQFGLEITGQSSIWQDDPSVSFRVTDDHIRRNFYVELLIRSSRKYHARSGYDDKICFSYQVLPR